MTREELSRELVKLREKAGVERPEIYNKYKMAPNSIISLEAGERNFKLDVFFKYLSGIYMHLHLVSKDGDEKKNITIKQPWELSLYIKKIFTQQRTNRKEIRKAGIPKNVTDRLIEGDLSSGIDGLLSFLDAANYDVSFQVNEIMKERSKVMVEVENDSFRTMSKEEILSIRTEVCEMLAVARKKNVTLMELIKVLGVLPHEIFRIEKGISNCGIDILLQRTKAAKANLFILNLESKIRISSKKELSKIIKKERLRAKQSMDAMAKRIGLSVLTLNNAEKGDVNSSIDIIIQILNYFGYKITIE